MPLIQTRSHRWIKKGLVNRDFMPSARLWNTLIYNIKMMENQLAFYFIDRRFSDVFRSFSSPILSFLLLHFFLSPLNIGDHRDCDSIPRVSTERPGVSQSPYKRRIVYYGNLTTGGSSRETGITGRSQKQ